MNLPGRILDHKVDGKWQNTSQEPELVCEDCCSENKAIPELATIIIQGETDSFGYEELALCGKCHQKTREPEVGSCDWCKNSVASFDKLPEGSYLVNGEVQHKLYHVRDYEEGMNGPVYRVCSPCRAKQQAQLEQEFSDFDLYDRNW